MRLILACCTSAVFVAAVFPAQGSSQGTGTGVPSNFEILERISQQSMDELIMSMPAIPADKLVLLEKEKGIGDIDFVFVNLLVKRMRENGLRIAVDQEKNQRVAPGGPDYRFAYQLIQMYLKYPTIKRRYWLGAKRVERFAEISVFAQLVDLGTGDVVWVGDAKKAYKDGIPYSLLRAVEDEGYGFTKPARDELHWSKILEPVVVGGIVAGLVYLFFSNQSND